MKFPVFDLHCDTASKLMLTADNPVELLENSLHIDIKRGQLLDGYAQCFTCFTTTEEHQNPMMEFERQLTSILSEITKNNHLIRQAYTAKDIEKNNADGVISAILTLEGTAGIGYDPALLEDLYKIGFRMSTLGWNEKNPLTGSQATGGGLTDQGAEYVKEAQRLGMLIDVSHISDEGFWDIMDITTAPIVATHSNSRAVCNVNRNLTDEMFAEICRTDGVAGINLYAEFLGKQPDLDTVCDHIFHFLSLDPSGTHIVLGGDLDGCSNLAAGFQSVADYPKLVTKLRERGLDDQSIQNIFWNNAIGVMKKCCI